MLIDRRGTFATLAAPVVFTLVALAGGALDMEYVYGVRARLQQSLDSGVLVAARQTTNSLQRAEVERYMTGNLNYALKVDYTTNLKVTTNTDGSITATFSSLVPTTFLGIIGLPTIPVTVKATAKSTGTTNSACVYVLGSSGQDTLINSGVKVDATKCEFHAQSVANPAFIMNSGSTLNFLKFCVKGTNYIKNGGTMSNLTTNCAALTDPYAGKLPEPTVPGTCTTSGYFNTSTVTMQPGVHCATGFNGTPVITFKPGLHIIKGTMIINSNATIIANDVTFYFPDTSSQILINGGVTFTGTAPTSGTYKGIFMYEKTSDANNNKNKTQYIFNGSKGETLEGVIYLPNRNVTYNSTSTVAAKISLVVNQMTINSANWKIEPYTGYNTATGTGIRLTE